MNTAKIFKTGRSQAVRLPKEYRFTTREVYISRVGESVILTPKKKAKGWEVLEEALKEFTPDFMAERNPHPASQEREPLE